ncbi:MAG: lipid A biosynthesis acyltransferase, partial [Megasphaera micronuciformis]|nr:lipid A biosynthesis acyltransferase [Megasphaera micronuciformis]
MLKNWQYHAVRAIGRFVCLFSYDTIVKWGRKLGPVAGRLLKKQRNRGIFHVMRGLKCDEAEAVAVIDGVFANLGQSLMEILYTPRLNKDCISRYVTLD